MTPTIDQVMDDVRALKAENDRLRQDNASLNRHVARLIFQIHEQQQDIDELVSVRSALLASRQEMQSAIVTLLTTNRPHLTH